MEGADTNWRGFNLLIKPFEFGTRSFQRNSQHDWDRIRSLASSGEMGTIPSEIYIRYYTNLHKIRVDSEKPNFRSVTAHVYWGPTGTGKSHTAWDRAGPDAFSKDPRTKFWCGYQGQSVIIIDEFRGAIDISHMLRWLDRYPCRVETKGSSRILNGTSFYITSNLHPREWYSDLDPETYQALERRLTITNFLNFFNK